MTKSDSFTQPRSTTFKPSYTLETGLLYKVLENRQLAKSTYCLRLERNNLKFRAGQLLNVGVPGMGVNREYSIYSGVNEPFIDVLIREVEGGTVSVALRSVKPGDKVEVHGPYGEFCLTDPTNDRSYLFIGTGTGVAPFHCFAKSFPNLKYQVLHGIRLNEECYDQADYKPGSYVACVSQESGGQLRGRVTDYLRNNKIDPNSVAYLCGNRAMINEVYGLLRDQGMHSDNIFTEVFF